MSKHNKVNKSNYDQGGRLTPDELAREQKKQVEVAHHGEGKDRATAKPPGTRGGRVDTPHRTEHEESK
jgi:hypothetical protein